jgi:formylglycine-generating enzyme required for sulfatase activity
MNTLKAVISSTARDLPEHRAEVMAACQGQDVLPKMMEQLPASDADAIEESLALVDAADIYIGIFALRYGYEPAGHDVSITEMEYERALGRGIPRLLFLSHEEHPFTRAQMDRGPAAEKLDRLRKRLESERVVAYFRSPASLRGAVSEALAKHLRGRKAVDEAATQPEGPPRLEDNPYRSLAAFQQEDAPWFFGRDELVRDTLARFYAMLDEHASSPRFLAVLGPSGSGKSSFARAGLMARLETSGSSGQKLATLVPGERPLASLEAAVAKACGQDHAPRRDQRSEDTALAPSPLDAFPDRCCQRLTLLVDQFEEVWSQCDSAAERKAFIDALLHAASVKAGPVAVIITMRSDFLGQSQRHPELNALITRQAVLIPALSAEGLRAAIAEPAQRAGYPLDEKVIGALLEETLGREAVLPLLQFALSGIWQGMAAGVDPRETLNRLGGVGGALASEAEKVYGQLNPDERAIARRAFTAMVQLGEGAEDTRRRVSLRDISGQDSPERIRHVLERFADRERRLVTLGGDEPDKGDTADVVAEVTHEALFSHWGTLRQWLDDGREDIRLMRRLEPQVEAWFKSGKARGLLWRPPDLSLLEDYHQRHAADMTPDQIRFLKASQAEIRREKSRGRLLVGGVIGALTLVAGASLGTASFFAFATRYGLDVAQASHALKIRYGLIPASPSCTEGAPLSPDQVALPCMKPIPSGNFTMGSNDGSEDERPPHPVTFPRPFTMNETEVTFAQYDAFAEAVALTPPPDNGWGRRERPVVNVSWRDAEEYAQWLGAVSGEDCALPTEAEWEYAARAGTTTAYSWGDEIGENNANCAGCGSEWDGEQTAPVGSFDPNPWGLYDLHGNVFEWVRDCWHDDYLGAPNDGSAWLEDNGGDCGRRVLRDGSWLDSPDGLRAAARGYFNPGSRFGNIGFRVVCRPHAR